MSAFVSRPLAAVWRDGERGGRAESGIGPSLQGSSRASAPPLPRALPPPPPLSRRFDDVVRIVPPPPESKRTTLELDDSKPQQVGAQSIDWSIDWCWRRAGSLDACRAAACARSVCWPPFPPCPPPDTAPVSLPFPLTPLPPSLSRARCRAWGSCTKQSTCSKWRGWQRTR